MLAGIEMPAPISCRQKNGNLAAPRRFAWKCPSDRAVRRGDGATYVKSPHLQDIRLRGRSDLGDRVTVALPSESRR